MAHADAILEALSWSPPQRGNPRRPRLVKTARRPECPDYEDHRWSWGIRMRECTKCGRVET